MGDSFRAIQCYEYDCLLPQAQTLFIELFTFIIYITVRSVTDIRFPNDTQVQFFFSWSPDTVDSMLIL